MHRSLDEFEIRPDPTTGFHGNGYCYNYDIIEKRRRPFFSVVLDGIFSCLQVMIAYIRAWMNLIFGQIRPRTTELAALKHLKN